MKEDQERTPLRTILQNFINHIESLETERIEDSYEKEFQELKFFSEILKTSKQYHCSEGEKEVNRKKNRYKDILPFDNSRVILEEYVGVPGSDYINANFIKGASGSPAYIASQGPLPHTVNDFWRMVVECEVQVIVMACNQEEAGKHKCENYWVENEGEEKQFGNVTIRLLKASIVCPDFLVRTMLLKYTNGRSVTEERTVCQFHYSAWPDHGVPPLVRPLLDMVRLVRDTQASETLPVLVHCSAGCGRTGTICAIDYVFGLLRAGKLTKDFSLYTLVRDMRKQRIAMVQTKEQYVLVHQAVRELFCEQLRMIDAHPYENIDANGMPLIKEPMYDTITNYSTNQEENSEKQDEKEKEKQGSVTFRNDESNSMQAPPLPHKKKLHLATSKQEKEVENLTEKRRCAVEQSSGSDSGSVSSGMSSLLNKPRIAKLKALFERNSTTHESRNNRGRRHGSQQVTRSHSLGPVRKVEADSSNSEWRPIPGAGILRVPQLSTTVPATKPALPVKRSKSLRVMSTGERQQLSVLTTENGQEVSSAQTFDSCDVVLVKSKCVANVNLPSVSDKKLSVPPKALLTGRNVETSNYVGTHARISRDGTLQQPQGCEINHKESYASRPPGSSGWISYENVPVHLRRRHSLESVVLEDISPSVDLSVVQRVEYVNVRMPPSAGDRKVHSSSYMDKGARKLLQDCKDYLVNSFQPSSQNLSKSMNEKHSSKPNEDTFRNDQLKHLSVEAQKKVKAIVAGLGVRERRNSFRQAVDTCRDQGRTLKDYETIWSSVNHTGPPDSIDLNKIWLEHRKEISRTPSTSFNSTYPFDASTDSHSSPKQSPQKLEQQSSYRNRGNGKFQLLQKPNDKLKTMNHGGKSLSQKPGGSLRVKGSQVLSFSSDHDLEEPGGLQLYANLGIKNSSEAEATNEHRYSNPPPTVSSFLTKTYSNVRLHPRTNAGVCRSSIAQVPNTGPDQGSYVKQTFPDDRVLYEDLKNNGVLSLNKDSYNWSAHLSSNLRDTRRGDATIKANSMAFKELTRTSVDSSNSSVPWTACAVEKLSPRATLQSTGNPNSLNSGAVAVESDTKSGRNPIKLPDPWSLRSGVGTNAQETDEHLRSRNIHAARQMPRGPVPVTRKSFGKVELDTADGTSHSSTVAHRTADEARKTNTSVLTSRAERDYGTSGFQHMRAGSQDDLALCPSAPPRVRRQASVVLVRRSVQETSDGSNAAPLTVWNDADTWAAGAGVDVDAVAASIKRQPGGQTATLARALESLHLRKASQRNESEQGLQSVPDSQGFIPAPLPVKKQHYL